MILHLLFGSRQTYYTSNIILYCALLCETFLHASDLGEQMIMYMDDADMIMYRQVFSRSPNTKSTGNETHTKIQQTTEDTNACIPSISVYKLPASSVL